MAKNKLKLRIVTPAKSLLEKEIDEVTLNTEYGQITVLANHIPLLSVLKPGEILVKNGSEKIAIASAGGIVEMSGRNTLTILADTAEHAKEINPERAKQKAQEIIKKLESKTKLDLTAYKALQRRLEKENARIAVAKKWR